jgi:hypothetical protein|tara:strand:+ start:282 stop:677 length:396 start_codon:yes stop_codon:yes gene_type:complete
MNKKYLAKIIANDKQGLNIISAYCSGAVVDINQIKYLPKNKIFLISLLRLRRENQKNNEKVKSICRFEFVDHVKSRNIDQKNKDLLLELITIDILKNKKNYEINLIFSNNAYITLSTEIVEVTLEDQNQDI